MSLPASVLHLGVTAVQGLPARQLQVVACKARHWPETHGAPSHCDEVVQAADLQ